MAVDNSGWPRRFFLQKYMWAKEASDPREERKGSRWKQMQKVIVKVLREKGRNKGILQVTRWLCGILSWFPQDRSLLCCSNGIALWVMSWKVTKSCGSNTVRLLHFCKRQKVKGGLKSWFALGRDFSGPGNGYVPWHYHIGVCSFCQDTYYHGTASPRHVSDCQSTKVHCLLFLVQVAWDSGMGCVWR